AAFASGARLVLMDTPFAALDQASVNCVRQWLERLARSPNRACVIADYQAPIALPLKQSLCLQHGALKTV
ncbi:MAG: hypothetical protein QE279_04705, partial [Rhodoferax sp.]|nr:hypothetical protein [Rhodoferax sp.]